MLSNSVKRYGVSRTAGLMTIAGPLPVALPQLQRRVGEISEQAKVAGRLGDGFGHREPYAAQLDIGSRALYGVEVRDGKKEATGS